MVTSNEMILRTKIGTEISILKSLLEELKPIILNNGGRKFEEGGSSIGTGAAEAWLEFSIGKEKYTIIISTKGKRDLQMEDRIKGIIWRKRENYIHLLLEIEYTMQGDLPEGLLKAVKQRTGNAKGNKREITWSYFIGEEQKRKSESTEISLEETTPILISGIQREKRAVLNEITAILEDFFILKKTTLEEDKLAAK